MSKIIRRPDRLDGPLTDAEKARMKEHADLWIQRILRTDPIQGDRIVKAIHRLYAAAKQPAPKHVVIVPSPLVLSIASGFAAAIWYAHHKRSSDATGAATRAATGDATRAATRAATGDATRDGWASELARRISPELSDLMISCAQNSGNFRTGGNHYGQEDSYLTAFRDVLGLRLAVHEQYAAWEECSIEGSWRAVHSDFCMVSDFPELIRQDEQHRPHCANGPSHRWRDGWELFHWHGTRIPGEWVTQPDRIDALVALTWENIEQRRCLAEILGWERVLQQLQARKIQEDSFGQLLEVDLPDSPGQRFVRVICGTGRTFAIPVDRESKTCLEAVARTYRVAPEVYARLQART